jgi:hypothetical protein
VVRFIGLEKLMQMRQKAKMGLQKMEDMGQMGNSEEATMPDDMPFDINDLDMQEDVDNESEMEYNRGGVVKAAVGTYVAPTVPTGYQPLGTNPMGNPTQTAQQVGSGVTGTSIGTPYTPNISKQYGGSTDGAYAPVNYNQFLGTSAAGAPQTESVRYFNEATGQTRMIPHVLNADGTRGDTIYPIPEGFVIQEEAIKEEAKKTQVQSAKVAPVDTGDGGPSDDDGKGGASLSFGGTKSGAGKGLQLNAITANISYNINPFGPMGVLGGLMTIGDINKGKDVATIGNKFGLTTNPVTSSFGKGKSISLTSAQYAQVKNNPTGPVAVSLKDRQVTLDALGKNNISYVGTKYGTGSYKDQDGKEVSADTMSQAGKDIADHISQNVSLGRGTTESMVSGLTSSEIEALSQHNTDVEDQQSFSGSGEVSAAPSSGYGESDGFGATEETDSGDYEATGGLLTKRKASGKIKDKWKKKMKRGGLASR